MVPYPILCTLRLIRGVHETKRGEVGAGGSEELGVWSPVAVAGGVGVETRPQRQAVCELRWFCSRLVKPFCSVDEN